MNRVADSATCCLDYLDELSSRHERDSYSPPIQRASIGDKAEFWGQDLL